MSNPLLEKTEFVNYKDIKPAHVLTAVEPTISETREKINDVLSK